MTPLRISETTIINFDLLARIERTPKGLALYFTGGDEVGKPFDYYLLVGDEAANLWRYLLVVSESTSVYE